MKLTTLLLIVSLFKIEASTYSQNTKITLKLDNVTVKEAFNKIESLSEFKFLYNHNKVDENRKLSIDVKKERISNILESMFSDTDIYFVVKKKQIILKTGKVKEVAPPVIVKVQQQKITGTVVDENGDPLPGVNIFVEGTDKGTATDFDGNFEIDVEKGAVLKLSFVGYESQFITIGDQLTLTIQMVVDAAQLEEVVVTALGITRKKASLGYSTTNLAGADVATIKQSNVINGLTGKVAGIVITPSSAGMGGSSRVILRGTASLQGNNQPLYVVDGIPINNGGFGSVSNSRGAVNTSRSDYGSGISDLNPDDIESMSVLKGPNAAALYGSRAANGVIMITTKSGKKGTGLGVSFTSNVMVSSIMEETLPKFQNEYGQGSNGSFDTAITLENWGSKFDGSTYTTVRGVERTYSAQPNNIIDYFKPGIEAVNSVTLQGGSDNASVRFSYSNFYGEGILPNATLGKHNFNLRAKVDLSDKLSIDAKATYFTQEGSHRPVQGWNDSSISTNLYRFVRNVDLRDFDDYGDDTGSLNPYKLTSADNPNWTQYRNTDDDFRRRTLGFVKATYKFTDNLTAFARIGTDALTQRIQQITPFGHWVSAQGNRRDKVYEVSETNADFLLMFNKGYDNFSINLNAGGNYKYDVEERLATKGQDFKIPTSTVYSNAETVTVEEQWKQRNSIYSLYFSGEFGYKEMAYLSFSGRNDWDSRMWTTSGKSSDYSFFYPSVSLSLLGNKILGIDDGLVSFSKLRLSYAEVSNGAFKSDKIIYNQSPTAGYLGTISVSKRGVFDDPDLVPERTKSVELGLELKLFNNRLYTDFTYYKSNTFDQILNAPVDPSTGFGAKRTNIGEISNNGFEFLIGGSPIQTDDFYWNISFNIAKNESTLESYIEGSDSYLFTSYGNFNAKTKVGGQIGDIYGKDFVYNDGKLVVDTNGLPVVSEEQEFLGNYQADFTGGISNTFSYKNVKLSFLIDFRQGGKAYSFTERDLKGRGNVESTLAFREGTILDAVVNTGTDEAPNFVANTTEINAQGYFARVSGIEAAHMYDLSNARLRELTLAYNFPSKWLENTFISRASLSFVGRNLFFFYKHIDADPEVSVATGNNGQGSFYYNLPSTRNLGFNLNISF